MIIRPVQPPIVLLEPRFTQAGDLVWETAPGGDGPWTPAAFGSRLLAWYEARAAANSVVSSAFDTLVDLSGQGRTLQAPAAGQRPSRSQSYWLAGGYSALTDGVDDYLRIASTQRPVTTYVLCRVPAHVGNGYPICSFGATYPYIGRSDVASCIAYYSTATTTTKCNSAPMSDLYFHLIRLKDDGLNIELGVSDPTLTSWVQVATGTDATARAASPGAYALGAFANATLPTLNDCAALVHLNAWGAAADDARMLDYARRQIVEIMTQPRMRFVGTRTTQAGAQPRPYPTQHEGQSGDTIATWGNRLVGTWSDWTAGHYVIGGAGDPGAGNRGAVESIVNAGNTSLLLIANIGGNDASGVISVPNTQLVLQRFVAIAQNLGATVKILMCSEPLFSSAWPTQNGNLATYNTGLAAMVTSMQGSGYAIVFSDCAAAFNTSTMLQADGIHCNPLGDDSMASTMVTSISGAGWISPSIQIVPSGHSRCEGGDATMPGATAGWRPALARTIAAAGG